MKTFKFLAGFFLLSGLFIIACQKEVSYENHGRKSRGSLQGAPGNCLGITVAGVYKKDTALNTTNYIDVIVNVDTAGTYTIGTDTANGISFHGSGTFGATGTDTIRLMGTGTPLSAGTNTFNVYYDSSFCSFSVTTLPSGTPSATFTLAGAPNACTGATPNGTYTAGTATTSSNTATISVNVTAVGTYNITTTAVNGVSFSASGTFTTTGTQTVTLQATGTPTAAGNFTYTVTAGSSSCTFPLTVGSGSSSATFTLAGAPNACTGATPNGTYTAGVATTATNTVTITVNVTVVGSYSITTNTVNGVSFSKSGTFSTTGSQTVTLAATGTPTAAGSFTYTVTAGTSSCTFQLTVGSGSSSAVFTLVGAPGACTGATPNGTYSDGIILTSSNTVTVQVNVTTVGSYTIFTNTVSGISFSASGTFSTTGTQTVTLNGTGTPNAPGTPTFTVTAGSSTCTFTLTINPGDYYPRVTNDNWSYDFNSTPTDTLYRKVIPQTLSAIGNTYNIFMETADVTAGYDSSGYYRKVTTGTNGDYYEYLDVGGFFGLDNPVWGEYIFLKDYQTVGSTWNSPSFTGTFSGSPVQVRFRETIQQQNVSITVNSVTYPNTIVVREDYEYFNGTAWVPAFTGGVYGIWYFSKNVGMIKNEYFDNTNTSLFLQELTRYQVF